ncbi:hypothetical protein [Photobacterium aquimaris]|uniref:Phenylalanyl-tRNA synthetase subunit alpha n=1 Tax=Photobacterium aquimaris TaxID=512643 RepID=A0A1B8I5J4_9GAMM|nr:hypothetical protein [Photobacterium aquimaris]OBU26364.1 phenylalanyl-tRNA synthetase subunit alpha [Photobacterium aquimaris]PQJ40887.1 phenylalanyl-tRNA synthetase subunit alpha [Photobacterium aquimaris]PSU12250.1 phenylalanyl-tRNA synthetase subunit alpha [Photobacterium aquimaris]SMY15311.1 hypothetical protein PAQU9191_00534 [Photobacterium aquimaris]
MNTKDLAALSKISTIAAILCTALLLLGNYGLASAMPIAPEEGFNFINLVFFMGFNTLFVTFLAFLLKTLATANKKRNQRYARA